MSETTELTRVRIVKESFPNDSRTGADQWLLQDAVTGDHYVASGVHAMFSGWEVLVFPADENGKITSWGEVAGGRGISHLEAIRDLDRALAS